jgi:hypothetical protein
MVAIVLSDQENKNKNSHPKWEISGVVDQLVGFNLNLTRIMCGGAARTHFPKDGEPFDFECL